jgi:SNF2 family DNA or RNA helicase
MASVKSPKLRRIKQPIKNNISCINEPNSIAETASSNPQNENMIKSPKASGSRAKKAPITEIISPLTIKEMVDELELDNPLPNGWNLFTHQKEAVIECLTLKRSILAYDMGLGKTVIALLWAKAHCVKLEGCLAIIIAPVTLKEIWTKNAKMLGFTPFSLSGDLNSGADNSGSKRKAKKKNAACEIAEEKNSTKTENETEKTEKNKKNKNYENEDGSRGEIKNNIEGKKIYFSLWSWGKLPTLSEVKEMGFSSFVFIADEAHAMQSIKSLRTKAAIKLCLDPMCW